MHDTRNGATGRYTDWIIRWRWPVIVVSVLGVALLATGARRLTFQQNYRIFFGPNNPQLVAFDAFEAIYAKNDNHIFVIHNPDGSIFNAEAMTAARELTEAGWEIPNATRVDSIVNYQHSWAEEDDLIVEDLVPIGSEDDAAAIARAEVVARSEPVIAGNVVSHDGDTTLVVVRIHLNEQDPAAVGNSAAASRALLERIREDHPDLRFELSGTGMLSNAFGEAPQIDARTVFPVMFLLLVVFLYLFTRSITGTLATWGVIVLSAVGAMGAAGYYGYGINPANVAAPVIILTLAIADSVHILLTMFKEMNKGMGKLPALRESMRINGSPVFLTSLTTAIGFLVMNFSDSPPFHELGNMTATGVGIAWVLSVTFLPALLAVLPINAVHRSTFGEPLMRGIAEFNIRHRWKLAIGISAIIVFLMASILRMKINDVPHQYFKKSIEFRNATDFFDAESGFYGFYMSVNADGPGGVSDPAYLDSLDQFAAWLREQDGVEYVSVYSEVVKRLNRNLHGDDPEYYRIPDDRELAAQYLLLYEMSLPIGMDLNDQINVDKSASRVLVNFRQGKMDDVSALGKEAELWLREHGVHATPSPATGPPVMFANITRANIYSMIRGTLIGFGLIALILFVSLRSMVLGALSLVPNMVPAATAFGIWALVVGEAGFAISVVAGLSIGIIVDDTVHFLSKYSRGRIELGLSGDEAVRYAFTTVGQALLSTSLIVAGGFAVLMLSTFRVTSFMGALTSLTVVCALITDFLLLPPLLLILDRRHIAEKALRTQVEQA